MFGHIAALGDLNIGVMNLRKDVEDGNLWENMAVKTYAWLEEIDNHRPSRVLPEGLKLGPPYTKPGKDVKSTKEIMALQEAAMKLQLLYRLDAKEWVDEGLKLKLCHGCVKWLTEDQDYWTKELGDHLRSLYQISDWVNDRNECPRWKEHHKARSTKSRNEWKVRELQGITELT